MSVLVPLSLLTITDRQRSHLREVCTSRAPFPVSWSKPWRTYRLPKTKPCRGGAFVGRKRCVCSLYPRLSIVTDQVCRLILQHLEPVIHFSSIIIAEPMLSPAGPQYLKKLRTILVKGAYERRDVWPDKESAMRAMKRRDRTKNWDPRILELFVVCAILSLISWWRYKLQR